MSEEDISFTNYNIYHGQVLSIIVYKTKWLVPFDGWISQYWDVFWVDMVY